MDLLRPLLSFFGQTGGAVKAALVLRARRVALTALPGLSYRR